MPIYLTGVNHQTASIEVREKFALGPDQLDNALKQLASIAFVSESAIISTCNRTEFIVYASEENSLLPFLESVSGLRANDIENHLYHFSDHSAVQHLFRVASGLDSMIIGEAQILGQVKQAWHHAKRAETLHSHLDRLFQQTFNVAKRCRSHTGIGEHAVSVAYASVTLAKNLFSDLSQHQALLIGAGETTELVAKHLREQNIGQLHICNRNLSHAQELANSVNAKAYPLEKIVELLPQVDLVISSTAANDYILTKQQAAAAIKQRRHRSLLLVDLAVPRDIDPALGDYDDNYIYSVDDLNGIINQGQRAREAAAEQAELIVTEETQTYFQQQASLASVEHIRALREFADSERQELTEKALKQIAAGADIEGALQQFGKQLCNKLLHTPTMTLKQAAASGDDELLSAANKILLHNSGLKISSLQTDTE